ncbi:hypothetical protein PENTCL1PPCAC_9732, partial [Pristionchus entomophagus]
KQKKSKLEKKTEKKEKSRYAPRPRKAAKKTNSRCVLCGAYPSSALGYASHLKDKHGCTLTSNGIYLICECGDEIHSHRRSANYPGCEDCGFSLHK